MKYFFGLKSNRRVKVESLREEKKSCSVSSLVTAEEGWEIVSFSGREFKIKSFICSLRYVGHKVKIFILCDRDKYKGKIHIYGSNDLSMDNQMAIEYYLERARMDNKFFRTAKSYLALSRGKFHKLRSYNRHFHIVMLAFTILLLISRRLKISMYQLIKSMVKNRN